MILDVNRVEKKYLINPVDMAELKGRLSYYMEADPHNGLNGYLVRSVYFDSLYDRDYQEKMDGLDNRKKIRLRVYDPKAETVKLELKEKSSNMQRKQSLEITRDQALKLLEGNLSVLLDMNIPLATKLYSIMMLGTYRPKCIVEYDRFAFILPENNTRITFDSNLRTSESDIDLFTNGATLYPVGDVNDITLEVKYDQFLLSNVKHALSHKMGTEISSSKYCRARYISK